MSEYENLKGRFEARMFEVRNNISKAIEDMQLENVTLKSEMEEVLIDVDAAISKAQSRCS